MLNEAYVPQNINQETIEHIVGRIQASNYLYFIVDKLDPKGIRHNKLLNITVQYKDILIGKVLIDNDSILHMLPRHMLEEMPNDVSHMKPSNMMVRAYNGSLR